MQRWAMFGENVEFVAGMGLKVARPLLGAEGAFR